MSKELKFILLTPLRVLGILKLTGFLTDKKDIYSTKEKILNWMLFLCLALGILSALIFSGLTTHIDMSTVENLSDIPFSSTEAFFGAAGFILLLLALILTPFKTYFSVKRGVKKVGKEQNETKE